MITEPHSCMRCICFQSVVPPIETLMRCIAHETPNSKLLESVGQSSSSELWCRDHGALMLHLSGLAIGHQRDPKRWPLSYNHFRTYPSATRAPVLISLELTKPG